MSFEYEYGEYNAGGIYIAAMENGDLYDDVSVCLVEYGIVLEDNQIAIPRKGDYEIFIDDLAKSVDKIVHYGSFDSTAAVVNLKDNWKDLCHSMYEE